MSIEHKVAAALIDKKKTITIAESCTGGLVSHKLTNISGSSQFLKLGLTTYCNESKRKLLKVPPSTLKKYGAVSSEVAMTMAQGARKLFDTDFGIGITGIAGPTGGSKSKPVGLTFIAVDSRLETLCLQYQFKGSRSQIKNSAAKASLTLLNEFL